MLVRDTNSKPGLVFKSSTRSGPGASGVCRLPYYLEAVATVNRLIANRYEGHARSRSALGAGDRRFRPRRFSRQAPRFACLAALGFVSETSVPIKGLFPRRKQERRSTSCARYSPVCKFHCSLLPRIETHPRFPIPALSLRHTSATKGGVFLRLNAHGKLASKYR